METNLKGKDLHIRVTPGVREAIRKRAKDRGKSMSEYVLARALDDDDYGVNSSAPKVVNAQPTEAEQAAWNRFNVDNVQLLRRVTVLVKMVRFMIGRHLGVPEAEVDKLIRQYIETTRVDFPDRPDMFPAPGRD